MSTTGYTVDPITYEEVVAFNTRYNCLITDYADKVEMFPFLFGGFLLARNPLLLDEIHDVFSGSRKDVDLFRNLHNAFVNKLFNEGEILFWNEFVAYLNVTRAIKKRVRKLLEKGPPK